MIKYQYIPSHRTVKFVILISLLSSFISSPPLQTSYTTQNICSTQSSSARQEFIRQQIREIDTSSWKIPKEKMETVVFNFFNTSRISHFNSVNVKDCFRLFGLRSLNEIKFLTEMVHQISKASDNYSSTYDVVVLTCFSKVPLENLHAFVQQLEELVKQDYCGAFYELPAALRLVKPEHYQAFVNLVVSLYQHYGKQKNTLKASYWDVKSTLEILAPYSLNEAQSLCHMVQNLCQKAKSQDALDVWHIMTSLHPLQEDKRADTCLYLIRIISSYNTVKNFKDLVHNFVSVPILAQSWMAEQVLWFCPSSSKIFDGLKACQVIQCLRNIEIEDCDTLSQLVRKKNIKDLTQVEPFIKEDQKKWRVIPKVPFDKIENDNEDQSLKKTTLENWDEDWVYC